jgi:hypothetical protein
MDIRLQDQHLEFEGEPCLADPRHSGLEPGMRAGNPGNLVIRRGGEAINGCFDSAGGELREFPDEEIVDPGGIGHQGDQKTAFSGLLIELGPVRMKGEFATCHQEKKNPVFGQGIE